MDYKYPHWFQGAAEGCCGEYPPQEVCCEEPVPYKMFEYRETLKDRILCLLGDEVLFSVDARICIRALQYMKLK
jgi:hypothetical protein